MYNNLAEVRRAEDVQRAQGPQGGRARARLKRGVRVATLRLEEACRALALEGVTRERVAVREDAARRLVDAVDALVRASIAAEVSHG